MNNFDALSQYVIPSELLKMLLQVYELKGLSYSMEEKLDNNKYYLLEETLNSDTYFLANYLNLNISDNRMRLIITKNSTPQNNEERVLVGLKECLRIIRTDALNYPFNGSDLLQYLTRIFGKNSHKFTTRNFDDLSGRRSSKIKPISIRLTLEKLLEEYHQNINKNLYEKLYLSMITYLEINFMKPYSDHNDIISLLALYYMIIRSDFKVFLYISFFEKILNKKTLWEKEVALSTINYPEGLLKLNGMMNLLYGFIIEAYQDLKDLIRNNMYEQRMFKGDGIEQTIYHLPNIFTKDDIRRLHPNVSESTINRTLFKLRDEKIITPLGKGRSARWVKNIGDDDPRNIFGSSYESSNQE